MSLLPFWRSIIMHIYREPLRDHCYIDGGSGGRAIEPGAYFGNLPPIHLCLTF